MSELCFGQRIDPELGILEPWYVNACVDKIKTWDLSDKIVFEWGSGGSSMWWAMKAKELYSVDHNYDWYQFVTNELKRVINADNWKIVYVDTHEGDQSASRDSYIASFPQTVHPNICIVDGVHRYECAEYAVKVLKPEILIIDNHNQDYVFICPALDILLEGVVMERFIQPDHTNHEGRPWATAIFYLNK